MNKTELTPLSPKQMPQIMAIEQEAFGAEAWSEASFLSGLRQSAAHYVTVCDGETVLGYLGFLHILEEMEILTVATAKQARRSGVGKKMMAYVMDYARAHHVARILLEVRASNEAAIALYESFGFRKLGVRRAYYHKPKEDALIYEWTGEMRDASQSSV